MRKICILVVVLSAISLSSASAQAVWGGRLGLSRPTVSTKGESIDGKFGLELGPVLYYSLQNNWYINSGVMFSLKTFENKSNGFTFSLNNYFVDVPVYVGYSFPVGDLSFYAQVGPYIGIKLAESYSVSGNGQTHTFDKDAFGTGTFNAGIGLMVGQI